MNSTKILFLNMLKGDIKRYTYQKLGITSVDDSNAKMLTGQTISKGEIR